jgi:N-acetylglucosaminyldiphosphoundecaprenol N-acetyl-beta-D-mannosaminyltransferase
MAIGALELAARLPRSIDPQWRMPIPVAGVDFAPLSIEETKALLEGAVRRRERPALRVATVNLDHLALARQDDDFRRVLLDSELAVADGKGPMWLARLGGERIPARVTGADLTVWLLDGGLPGASLYLLGSTPEVIEAVSERASEHGVRIVGSATPGRRFFEDDGLSEPLVRSISRTSPDVLLVALGAPAQERWIHRWHRELGVAVAIGVGGSLDFAAGAQKRAPAGFQRAGLEWLYRLCHEPRRLFGRYVRRDIPFLVAEGCRTLGSRPVSIHRPILRPVAARAS